MTVVNLKLVKNLDGFCRRHLQRGSASGFGDPAQNSGEVVRSIGACYTYITEDQPVPFGLNERILQATLGTLTAAEVRAPLSARFASWLRILLDPIVSPQLATVATMLLLAVFVLANTVSADGSISGVYQASLRLAEQSYENGLKELVGGQ